MLRLLFPALAATLLAVPTHAEGPCATGEVVVTAPSEPLETKTCRAAETAVAAFAACGFALPGPVIIEVKNDISEDCLALFHCGEAYIEMLTPEAMNAARQTEGGFAHIPVDRLYDSAVVHELAHALYDPVRCPYRHCRATSEYLAYTYQIANLSSVDRAPFDEAALALGDVPRDAINSMMLMFAPGRFAEKSWAHLNQRADRCGYLQSIMSGTTVFDHFMP